MNDLLLKPKQLRSEGFPIELKVASGTANESLSANVAREKMSKMSPDSLLLSQTSALELVSALSISTVFGDESQDEGDIDKGDDISKNEHFIRTFSHGQAVAGDSSTARPPNIFALDCEMVQTSVGPELARVSVIKFTGSNGKNGTENGNKVQVDDDEERSVVVLDELVKPRRKVLDYLTGDKV